MKRTLIGGFALLVLMAGGEAEAAATPEPISAFAVTRMRARVGGWTDGDTVRAGRTEHSPADRHGHAGTGRECYIAATRSARRLAPVGSRVTLVRVLGRDNADRYHRKLRYVHNFWAWMSAAADHAGLADARYDGRDGYGAHPRQGSIGLLMPPPGSGLHAGPAPAPVHRHPAYSPCVPPPPPDLDCAEIGHSVSVNHAYGDPHNLDADGDGVGCERNG